MNTASSFARWSSRLPFVMTKKLSMYAHTYSMNAIRLFIPAWKMSAEPRQIPLATSGKSVCPMGIWWFTSWALVGPIWWCDSLCLNPGRLHMWNLLAPEMWYWFWEEAKFLPEQQAQAFIHTVVQLLFLLQTYTTRHSNSCLLPHHPPQTPWQRQLSKLKQILRYLRGMRNMKLNLSTNNLTTIRWWVDASHVVHNNCPSHTGGAIMSLGKGAAISFSY